MIPEVRRLTSGLAAISILTIEPNHFAARTDDLDRAHDVAILVQRDLRRCALLRRRCTRDRCLCVRMHDLDMSCRDDIAGDGRPVFTNRCAHHAAPSLYWTPS